MANMNPQGIDLATGQNRIITSTDTLVNSSGSSILPSLVVTSPTDLGGRLIWWLEADSGVFQAGGAPCTITGEDVATWTNRSPAQSTISFTQGTANLRPDYISSVSAINNKPAVDLGGVRWMSIATQVGPMAATILCVCSRSNWATATYVPVFFGERYTMRIAGGTANGWVAGDLTAYGDGGVSQTPPQVAGVHGLTGSGYHLLTARIGASYSELRVNGAPISPRISTRGSFGRSNATHYVGTDGSNIWNGNIAALIIVDGTLSDSDTDGLETYLANKYGLTIT